MTETVEQLPESSPEVPAERPGRAHTVLGRLGHAVREQNWFAVVLEVLVVIVGVVVGFQVTGWGQARADRAKERGYLVQLDSDLRETLRRSDEAEAEAAPILRAAGLLVRAYRMPEPPPRDSLRQWMLSSHRAVSVEPVVATAEALIATGDLALIRDDSLRRAIPGYLSQTRTALAEQAGSGEAALRSFEEAARFFDFWGERGDMMPQAVIDSLAQADDTFGLPAGPRRTPFPFRAADLLADREIYRTLFLSHIFQVNMRRARETMRDDAEHLLARVAAAQGTPRTAPADTTAPQP